MAIPEILQRRDNTVGTQPGVSGLSKRWLRQFPCNLRDTNTFLLHVCQNAGRVLCLLKVFASNCNLPHIYM